MAVNYHERQTLRELARQVVEIAHLPLQARRARMWRRLNALTPERPMVLTDPDNCQAWEELIDESALVCQEPTLRQWELNLRRRIWRHQNIPDDRVITAALDVPRVVEMTSCGLDGGGLIRPAEHGGAYTWQPSLKDERELDKLHFQTVRYNHEQTQRNYDLAFDIWGDILDIRIRGGANIGTWFTGRTVFMRGLEQLMMDLYDRPQMIHRLMTFHRDNMNQVLDQYQELGVLSINTLEDDHFLMGGSACTDQLPAEDISSQVRLKDMWAYGESQEFVSVGPEQFWEFSLQYEAPVLRRFGLVAYGCCEPLDQKFDLVIGNLPNLRLVSVSPWCDRAIAAEKLANRYVYAWKPNPSMICSPSVDWNEVEKVTRQTLEIARGCCVEIVMKDLQTVHGDPSRLTQWTELAMRLAERG